MSWQQGFRRCTTEHCLSLQLQKIQAVCNIVISLLSQGQVLTGNDVSGALCIGQPWPGMARSIYGDHKRFVDAYFKPYPGKNTVVSHNKRGVAHVQHY